MSVGFGFSAGDFIAAIELVGTVIDALRSSGEAGAEYRELLGQLHSLETALSQVKRLEFDESQYTEVIALRQAAGQCRRTIDDFMEKIQKYLLSLGNSKDTRSISMKDGWRRIQWAVCKKDDVTRFKADLMGHTQSILLLLTTVQMGTIHMHEQRHDAYQKTLAARFQAGYFGCMQRMTAMFDQGKGLIASTAEILQINLKVFQIVLQLQEFVTRIPVQVERQQPIYLIDALGKYSPFHLEFVRSAEALISVLKANFKRHGTATERIGRGDFVIQDSSTTNDIDLCKDWDTCFRPGQHVTMSTIFYKWQGFEEATSDTCAKCPKCNDGVKSDIEGFSKCPSCNMVFQQQKRHSALESFLSDWQSTVTNPKLRSVKDTQGIDCIYKANLLASPRDEIAMFQRVRICHETITSGSDIPPWQHSSYTPTTQVHQGQIHYGYDLPCEFRYAGCFVRFQPQDFDAWISHSTSHFGDLGPPPRTVCTFCDLEFHSADDENAFITWYRRMVHIGSHFYDFGKSTGVDVRIDHPRPDFWTIEHLNRIHLICQEDYSHAVQYTETPDCLEFYPVERKPLEMLARFVGGF